MASPTTTMPDTAVIAEKAQQAAELQSEVDHAKVKILPTGNFQQAAATIGKKMGEHPEAITAKDASTIKSAEAKFIGVPQPPKGTLSAKADHLAAVNAKAPTYGSDYAGEIKKA
ncbi:hypothetical protein CAC42_3604 [Sphaceloma murrayae]|uniref:SMP domain-containing protein n=1 Tax=Sphaceloma murrayae TaxID=2082308 RepID=A0A2K1QT40_9PEZI|nr:hypothetical protein CAC42_3604 [Sphaceloma murrayae]